MKRHREQERALPAQEPVAEDPFAELEADPDFEIEDLRTEADDEDREEAASRRFRPHLILLAAMALVLGFGVFRLALWNRGEKIEYDPNADTSLYEVETEDYIMHLDNRYLEGHPDDGVTTVLCLGNEPFASARGENGIAEQLKKLLGDSAVVYNAAFEHTTLSCKNSAYVESDVSDAFCLYWLSRTICLQDFTLLDNSIDAFSALSPSAREALKTLESVDMSQVDLLLIMYDGSDYLEDRIITSPYDLSDIGTCTGALGESLTMLRQTYPYIRIVVNSPTYACQVDEDGHYLLGGTTNTLYKNGFLSDYMIGEKNIAVEKGVTFIDHYTGTIHEENYMDYLEDNIHLNDEGRKLVAQRIAAVLAQ